ncbi:hypothetical protein YC2023_083065 [Brassica napus]
MKEGNKMLIVTVKTHNQRWCLFFRQRRGFGAAEWRFHLFTVALLNETASLSVDLVLFSLLLQLRLSYGRCLCCLNRRETALIHQCKCPTSMIDGKTQMVGILYAATKRTEIMMCGILFGSLKCGCIYGRIIRIGRILRFFYAFEEDIFENIFLMEVKMKSGSMKVVNIHNNSVKIMSSGAYYRSWMDNPHLDPNTNLLTKEYVQGIGEFMRFVQQQPDAKSGMLRCLCSTCNNNKVIKEFDVWTHLYMKGFSRNYKVWYLHGETGYEYGSTSEP